MQGAAERIFKRVRLIALTCLALGATGLAPAAPVADAPLAARATTWTFTLPRQATTSAGIYDLRGRLLRTLWRAEALPAGVHRQAWDGRDDLGQPVGDAEVEFKLIHHRISHAWEGVIGNSSTEAGGPSIHRSFHQPTSIVPVGSRIYYGVGYNEGQPGIHGFSLDAPQVNTHPIPSTDVFAGHEILASDGLRLYWANTGGFSPISFVGIYELSTSKLGSFASGKSVCLNRRVDWKDCFRGYDSVIDVLTEKGEGATGLAVQRGGRLLAVAHGEQRLIRLFDKTTGALVREIAVLRTQSQSHNQLAMSPSGDLWVISGNVVLRYTDLEREPRVIATIDTLEHPLALGTAETGDEGVWVADGGASQQLKKFDREGQPVHVIGRKGGYGSEPRVLPDRLCFRSVESKEQTAIGVAADGSVWVVDQCNNRMLRFPAGAPTPAQSDAQIAYLPAVYTATVDHGNPQRVFANFLEFEVERNTPLVAGKSWKLVRNWLIGMPASLRDDRAANRGFGGFTSVETLANGRTYGLLSAQSRQLIVELPASGPLRVIKTLAQPMPGATAKVLYEKGDLGYSLTGPNSQTVLRQPIKGFDASGDPVWYVEPVKLASVPTSAGSPWHRVGTFSGVLPPRFPLTESGHVVFFDQSVVGNEGFHLGAAKAGSDQWLWQASPTGALDGKGSFQTKRLDQSTAYGGNVVWASGRHIIYGYHGEFYKDLKTGRVGQANQFMHFDESGLFIGQFGQPSTRPAPANLAGLSGNAFSPTLVRDGPRLYLYHNDESTHGGVHRWRIDGWDDIGEVRERISVGQTAGKATSMALAPIN
jgi:hypothetical protein